MKESDYWKTQQIGTGPFKFDKYTPGVSMELVRFDNYWRGAPKLDRIINRSFKDPASALLAFDAGEIHFTYITADEVARERENANAVVLPGNSGVNNGMGLNDVTVPAFGNVDFRTAIMTAIDRQSIVDNDLRRGREHRAVPVRAAEPAGQRAGAPVRPGRPPRSS